MRAVLQRVSRAAVRVEGAEVGRIGPGWAILLGIGPDDTPALADRFVEKIVNMRAFEDAQGKMNLSALDVGAAFLVVSQFTLYGDLVKGRRPSFIGAAPPTEASALVDYFANQLRARGFPVATGQFGATMDVDLVNHGPVTFVLTSDGWAGGTVV
ncbi:MAG TPA: D-aminoacyl-tRNA deacylase [Chloroflexota bacterium]|nr:D-aminoacyl-tRNA deacylase [Chloroflexota bacterium]